MILETWSIQGRAFHFGRHGRGQEECSERFTSDSLFAALTAAVAAVEGPAGVDAWNEAFRTSPPFALTSAFPMAGPVRFFPRPQKIFHSASSGKESTVPAKKLKKIRYVSERLFMDLLSNTGLEDHYTRAELIQNGSVLVHPDDYKLLPSSVREHPERKIWMAGERPRVTIQRDTSASNLFFTGQIVFAPKCGLWFGFHRQRDDILIGEMFSKAILSLSESGLGAERAIGFGSAQINKDADIELPDGQNCSWLSLSRYLPAAEEMSALHSEQAAYALEPVAGWIQAFDQKPERRREVHFVSEGAVLGPLPAVIPGSLVDVQPSYKGTQPLGHPVWRCGYAVAVGIKGG